MPYSLCSSREQLTSGKDGETPFSKGSGLVPSTPRAGTASDGSTGGHSMAVTEGDHVPVPQRPGTTASRRHSVSELRLCLPSSSPAAADSALGFFGDHRLRTLGLALVCQTCACCPVRAAGEEPQLRGLAAAAVRRTALSPGAARSQGSCPAASPVPPHPPAGPGGSCGERGPSGLAPRPLPDPL